MKPTIKTKKNTYTVDYPLAIKYAEKQGDIYWTAKEIDVEKDIQDFRVFMTDSERFAVTELLKLFTKYEVEIGKEYWGGRVMRMFPRPDIQRMANCFSFFELNVHAPFYDKLNKVMNIGTDEFYSSWAEDPVLADRMAFIDKYIADPDDALSLAVFSMVEGAVLYTSFAFFKHFQSRGKNLLKTVISGINFSVKDENLHSEAGAWLFKQLLSEEQRTPEELLSLQEKIQEAALKIYEHECAISSKIFSKGHIEGVTEKQFNAFAASRVNLCLRQLGYNNLFKVSYNPIAEWFYKGINQVQLHDFFDRQGNQYKRGWDQRRFEWKKVESERYS